MSACIVQKCASQCFISKVWLDPLSPWNTTFRYEAADLQLQDPHRLVIFKYGKSKGTAITVQATKKNGKSSTYSYRPQFSFTPWPLPLRGTGFRYAINRMLEGGGSTVGLGVLEDSNVFSSCRVAKSTIQSLFRLSCHSYTCIASTRTTSKLVS